MTEPPRWRPFSGSSLFWLLAEMEEEEAERRLGSRYAWQSRRTCSRTRHP